MFFKSLAFLFSIALLDPSNALALYPSLTIEPKAPDVGDTIEITLEGLTGGNSCWWIDSSSVVPTGDTVQFIVFLSNNAGGSCPQACLAEAYPYRLTEAVSNPSVGARYVKVLERSENICSGVVTYESLFEAFFVGNQECVPCVAADASGDGSRNIADVTFLIARIFSGGSAPPCPAEADVNGDGDVNIADATALIAHIFTGAALAPCEY